MLLKYIHGYNDKNSCTVLTNVFWWSLRICNLSLIEYSNTIKNFRFVHVSLAIKEILMSNVKDSLAHRVYMEIFPIS